MIYLVIALSFVLRLININQSFWLDEAAQMIEVSRPLTEQFDLAADFHPPLYHLLLHFWIKIGSSEIFARLPQALMGALSVYLIYRLAILFKFKKGAIPAAILLGVNPFHIWYSQEVRPYMLFAILSLVSTFYWAKRDWMRYFLINTLLLYSNYFSSFVLAGHLITTAILNKKNLSINLKSVIVSYIMFLPWLPKFLRQIEVGLGGGFAGWTEVVSESAVRSIPLTFAKFIIGKVSFDNNIIYVLVLLPAFLVFVTSCFLIRKTKEGRLVFILFLAPLILTFTVSLILPVVAPQRLIFLIPFFILIIAASREFLSKRIFLLNFSLVFLTFLLGLFIYLTQPQFQRENWRQSVEWVGKKAENSHTVLFPFPEPFAPFIWYNKYSLQSLGVAYNFKVDEVEIEKIKEEIEDKGQIFYYSYLSSLTDPRNTIRDTILQSGFNEILIKDFPGVGFIYYYEKEEV